MIQLDMNKLGGRKVLAFVAYHCLVSEEVAHASQNVTNLLPFSTQKEVGAALFQYCLDCRNAIT